MLPNARPLPNGLVIMFEGIDGVGKTTQLKLVQAALEQAGWPVVVTRNLGGTPIGDELAKVIMSMLERPPLTDFYTSLAIQEPLLDVIDAARAKGKIILMDRSPLSLAAYQIYGSGIDEALGWHHVQSGMARLKPEAVILYETDTKIALERGRERSAKADYFESKPLDYFEKGARGYKAAAGRYQATVIDAGQDIAVVQKHTLGIIASLLTPKA